MSLLRNRSRSSTVSSPSIPALDTSNVVRSQHGAGIAHPTISGPSPKPGHSPTRAPLGKSFMGSSATAGGGGGGGGGGGSATASFTDTNYLDFVLRSPTPQRIDLTQYRMHLELLHQPLPSSSNARRTAIAEREVCLQTLSSAVSYELEKRRTASAFTQARAASDGVSDEHGYAFVGSSNLLQLVLLLLSQEQPVPIRAAALDLLAHSIHLADARCPPSRVRTGALPIPTLQKQPSSAASGAAATTSTSISPTETIPHDEPVAGVERAAFYDLITNHDLSQAAAALGVDDGSGGRERLSVVSLPTLLPQLRALKALLGGSGTLQFGYLPNIVPLLIAWLSDIWPELQILRRRLIAFERGLGNGNTVSPSASSSMKPHDVRTMVAIKQLEVAERALGACFELLASLFKFSFAQIDPAHTELALVAVSALIVGPPPNANIGNNKSGSHSAPPALDKGDSYARPRGEGSSSRSKSRDAKMLTESYSYYGLESIDDSSPSPSIRPIQLGQDSSSVSGMTSTSSSTPLIAPMVLSTLPPSGRVDPMRAVPAQFTADDFQDPLGPILHVSDVEAATKLVDTILIFGLLPSESIEHVTRMICKILGYGPTKHFCEAQKWSEGAGEPIPDFEQETASLLANLLRNHCANAALRPAWELLAKPDRGCSQAKAGTRTSGQEDIAILVGALRFLKVALRFTADARTELARERQGKEGSSETPDLPFMPLSLLFMALRGALQRQSDLLDLEVLHLVAELLPAHRGSNGSAASLPPPYFDEPLTHSDWNSILDLTALARRHVEALNWKGAAPSPFESGLRSTTQDSPRSLARPTSAVTALVELLQRIVIAPPPTGEESSSQSLRVDADELPGQVLPWTPKLASLLLALAPQLPDNLIVDLVQYYRVEHFCVPATADWISNINTLLQALFHRHGSVARDVAVLPAPRARKSVATLVFEHVWSVVRDLPAERSKLMLNVIIPLAPDCLSRETDPEVETLLRKMLVDAAAVAGSAPDEGETDETLDVNRKNDRDVFNEIRRLLTKFARGSDSTSALPQTDFGPGPHVSFNVPKGEDPDSGDEVGSLRPLPPRTWGAARSLRPDNIPLSAKAAADLIGIFNKMAFGSAAAVRILTASAEQRERWEASQRAVWQKKIRRSCITVLRDLLTLLQPTLPEDAERSPASTFPENAFLDQDGTSSVIARLVILQWILRLRTDRHHRIYLEANLDDLVEPAATAVLRGSEEASDAHAAATTATAMTAQSSAERAGRRGRIDRPSAFNDPVARSRSKRRDRSRSMPPRGQQSGPLWTLPTTLLFELPVNRFRSGVVFTFIHRDATSSVDEEEKPEPLYVSEWLATVVNFFRYESNWDLLSYLICHLPHQLANKHLFNGWRAHIQVEHLRQLLCAGMVGGNLAPFVELRVDDAKKTDLYAVAYNSLTVLMSYRKLFDRHQQDEMVQAFLAGLNKSSTTAQPCIRALSIASYDLQKSVNRFLSGMNGLLSKLAKVMSSMTMSVHILELMATLVRLPACYANLNEDDYKLVFQICISYIQYHQSPHASGREDFRSSPQTFSLSQYVMMLAYFDLAVWFMTLKVSERPKYVADITRRLLIGCPIVDGVVQVTEQTETMFDFLARCTYSNLDPRPTKSYIGQVVMPPAPASERTAKESDKSNKSRSWLVGKGMMTVVSSKKTGWSEIIIRRPSGTTSLLVKAENSAFTAFLEDGGIGQLLKSMQGRDADQGKQAEPGPAEATGGEGAGVAQVSVNGMTVAAPEPSHLALQLSNYPDLSRDKTPIPAPTDNITERLLRNVDFVPVVDLHKLSVLWVGPGQKTEQAILGNRQGSPAFMRFMSGLGELFTLKDRMDLPTSLDRMNGMHGKYAYMWADHITQVFYHTATLMPNLPHDPTFTNKKALIGNDPVHIVFNESGDEYRFDTIPSQFNSINIVISPTYKGGTNLGSVAPDDDIFYRVSLQRQVNLPDFSPIGDGQLISADALPGFVRVLAINSNLMAQIYNATAETMTPYQSNWVERLRYFTRFRENLLREQGSKQTSNGQPASSTHQFTQVF